MKEAVNSIRSVEAEELLQLLNGYKATVRLQDSPATREVLTAATEVVFKRVQQDYDNFSGEWVPWVNAILD